MKTTGSNQMTIETHRRWLGVGGRIVAILAFSVLIVFALSFILFYGRDLLVGIVVIAPLWVVVTTLILAGADGREEAQRIIERPFDEREQNIRTKALGIGLAVVLLVNFGWIVYGAVDDHNVIAPVAAILAGCAAIVVAIDRFRRSSARLGNEFADEPTSHAVLAEETLGRPTWTATAIAWLIATLASWLVGGFFLFGMEQIGVMRLGFNDRVFGASGFTTAALSVAWVSFVVYVDTLVFTLSASRWLNRPVSFGWIFLMNAVLFASVWLVQGSDSDGSIALFMVTLLLPLPVLRYAAGQTGGVRGIARRLRLPRRMLGVASAAAALVVVVSAAYGSAHPIDLEPEVTTSSDPRLAQLHFDDDTNRYMVDLKPKSSLALQYRLKNRGVASLRRVRVTGVDTAPHGAAKVTSVRRGVTDFDFGPLLSGAALANSLGPHDEVRLRMDIAFACTKRQRTITVQGLRVRYEALGRERIAVVPVDDVVATCNR